APGGDGGGNASLAVHRAAVGGGVPGHGDGHAVGTYVAPAVPVAVRVTAIGVGAVPAQRAGLGPAMLAAGVGGPGAVSEAVALPDAAVQIAAAHGAVGGHGVLAGAVFLIALGLDVLLGAVPDLPAPVAGLGPAVQVLGVILPLAIGVSTV